MFSQVSFSDSLPIFYFLQCNGISLIIKYLIFFIVSQHLNVGGLDKKMLTLTEFKEILEPYAINRKDYMALCSMSQAFWGKYTFVNYSQKYIISSGGMISQQFELVCKLTVLSDN